MPSTPSADPAGAAPVPRPRQHRAYVTSYGVGRVCADPGCHTALSIYNKSERCYPHASERDARRHGDGS